MPEVADHYIDEDILLPRGDQMTKFHVVAQNYDANKNAMGRVHANPILDTRMYEVEFADGDVTELTANIIAESV